MDEYLVDMLIEWNTLGKEKMIHKSMDKESKLINKLNPNMEKRQLSMRELDHGGINLCSTGSCYIANLCLD